MIFKFNIRNIPIVICVPLETIQWFAEQLQTLL
jgi:hypothetical protein